MVYYSSPVMTGATSVLQNRWFRLGCRMKWRRSDCLAVQPGYGLPMTKTAMEALEIRGQSPVHPGDVAAGNQNAHRTYLNGNGKVFSVGNA